MTSISRNSIFLLIYLFIFFNFIQFSWKQYHSNNRNYNSLSGINRISLQKHSIFSNETSGCNDIYKHTNKCEFVREYCSDTSGLLNYLEYYFCDLENWQFFALTTLFLWLLFLFGFIGIAASDFFCPNLNAIAFQLDLSESMAGVTFLAFGNGSPDVFSTFSAMRHGSGSLAIGELIGAASFITLVVAGSMAVVKPYTVTKLPFLRDLIFFTCAILLTVVIVYDEKIRLWESVTLIIFYFMYVCAVVFGSWYVNDTSQQEQQTRGGVDSTVEVFDTYGHDRYSEATPLLSDGQTDNISNRETLPTYTDQESQETLTPNSVNDAMNFHHHHHHHHQNRSNKITISMYRGVRRSLLSAIEFHESFKLDNNARGSRLHNSHHHNEYYHHRQNRIMRSNTMPSYSSIDGNPRRKSWSSIAGPVTQSYDTFVDDDLTAPQINIYGPTPGRINEPSSSNTISNLNKDNDKENEVTKNLNVAYLSAIPPLSNQKTIALPINSSPTSLSPKSLPDGDTAPVSPWILESRYGSNDGFTYILPCGSSITINKSTWLTNVQETLFPSLVGFSQKSCFAKLTALIETPATLPLILTLPVVKNEVIENDENDNDGNDNNGNDNDENYNDENDNDCPSIVIDDDETTDVVEEGIDDWNKWLTSIQFLFAPIFISSVLFAKNDSIVTIVFCAFIVGLAMSILCILITDKNKPPKFYSLLCFMGFGVAMCWIFLVANEVVGLLQAIGQILELSDAILGLTIFAMGNSLGDLVANITLVKIGFPMMAISACFGGPMLNILFGVGISATYTTITTESSTEISIDKTLIVSVFGLLIGLCSALIYLPYNGYRMTRPWGYYLISIYIICITINVIMELNSMR